MGTVCYNRHIKYINRQKTEDHLHRNAEREGAQAQRNAIYIKDSRHRNADAEGAQDTAGYY